MSYKLIIYHLFYISEISPTMINRFMWSVNYKDSRSHTAVHYVQALRLLLENLAVQQSVKWHFLFPVCALSVYTWERGEKVISSEGTQQKTTVWSLTYATSLLEYFFTDRNNKLDIADKLTLCREEEDILQITKTCAIREFKEKHV